MRAKALLTFLMLFVIASLSWAETSTVPEQLGNAPAVAPGKAACVSQGCQRNSSQLRPEFLALMAEREASRALGAPKPSNNSCIVCEPCTCWWCNGCCSYDGCLCLDQCEVDDWPCVQQCENAYFGCLAGCSP